MRIKTILIVMALVFITSAFIAEEADSMNSQGQLVVYIETPAYEDMEVQLSIDKLELISDQDTILLQSNLSTLNSLELSDNQMLLVEQAVPAGLYNSLKIYYKEVKSRAGTADIYPEADLGGVSVSVFLELSDEKTETIFLVWNPDSHEFRDESYIPNLRTIKRMIPPDGSLIYVSNESSGNLSLIDHSNYKVVEVIKVGEQPKEMVYSLLRRELYVANTGSHSISVIDMDLREVNRTILLNTYDEPIRLILSADENSLYILNSGSDNITIIDLNSYEEVFSYNVGYEPFDMAFDYQSGDMFISSQISNTLINYNIINQQEINSILMSGLIKEIELTAEPLKLLLANKLNRTLTIISLENAEREFSVNLCDPVTSMVFDTVASLLYAAIETCAEIVIIDPELKLDVGSIELIDSPKKISLSLNTNELMVSYSNKNKIGFYNLNNRQLIKEVMVGQNPYMALMP